MDARSLKELEQPIIELARLAGVRILKVYDTAFDVTQKEDRSPLTEADLASHETIIQGLQALTPNIPILSEEGKETKFKERKSWKRFWLIDPLDGTREFVKRNDEFAVNIALIEEHEPVLGVVYAPVLGDAYVASKENGASKKRQDGQTAEIRVRAVAGNSIVVAGSRSHAGGKMERYLEKLGGHSLLSMGSALKACLVAEGEADIYPRFGPTSEWDTAAPQCILEQAGGFLTDLQMQPLRYNTKKSLINPSFFAFGDRSRNWSHYL